MLAAEMRAFMERVEERLSQSCSSPEFWRRDDDFASIGKALDQLKHAVEMAEVIPLLAVIPERVDVENSAASVFQMDGRFRNMAGCTAILRRLGKGKANSATSATKWK